MMKVFFNERHALHHGRHEMFRGELVPCFEVPALDIDCHHGNGMQATFAGDPLAGFTLASEDYLRVGEDLAAAGLPTLFVFEGGYAVAEVGGQRGERAGRLRAARPGPRALSMKKARLAAGFTACGSRKDQKR